MELNEDFSEDMLGRGPWKVGPTLRSDDHSAVTLRSHELTLIRSFPSGAWFSNLYVPPVPAKCLNDVSFDVNQGEIHGIIGASGSGKTTLLLAMAHKVDGQVTGEILLSDQPLTEERFTKLCTLVNFEMDLMPNLTVQQYIEFEGMVSLNCSKDVIIDRATKLMRQFDLTVHAEKPVKVLSPSARHRLTLVLHLVRDPLLILLDDPFGTLDALNCYHLMSALREYVKEHCRIAVVATRYPRSDIYQLMAGITMLFFGDVVYSGPTKYMPHYFSQIGYKCPVTENPAVYYLSLATVDRETQESYDDTHAKAMKLVETFKKNRAHLEMTTYRSSALESSPVLSCYFGPPSVTRQLFTLVVRHVTELSRCVNGLAIQFVPLVFSLFLAAFGGHFYTTTKHTPFSASGTIFCLVYSMAASTVLTTVATVRSSRATLFWEVSQDLYNACLIPISALLTTLVLDVILLVVVSTCFTWIVQPAFSSQSLVSLMISLATVLLCYKLLTIALVAFWRDEMTVIIIGLCVATMSSIVCSGFVNPEQFSNQLLNYEFVNKTRVSSCRRNEQIPFQNETDFCRWRSGTDYLSETYPEPNSPPEKWQGGLICLIYFLVTNVVFFVIGYRRAGSYV